MAGIPGMEALSSGYDTSGLYGGGPFHGYESLNAMLAGMAKGSAPGMEDLTPRSGYQSYGGWVDVPPVGTKLPEIAYGPGGGGDLQTPLSGAPSAHGYTVGPYGELPPAGPNPYSPSILDSPSSGGGGGGSGGGGGGGGGISSGASKSTQSTTNLISPYLKPLIDQFQQAQQQQYQQMMGVIGQTTGQRAADIRQAYQGQRADIGQQLARAGMANTTVLPTMQAGINREEQSALNRLADELQQTKLGVMGQYTPNTNQGIYGQLLGGYTASPGQTATTGQASVSGTDSVTAGGWRAPVNYANLLGTIKI
jgi:hypothetical protein